MDILEMKELLDKNNLSVEDLIPPHMKGKFSGVKTLGQLAKVDHEELAAMRDHWSGARSALGHKVDENKHKISLRRAQGQSVERLQKHGRTLKNGFYKATQLCKITSALARA